MADLTTALFARWTGDTEIAAIIATRAYPVIRPQNSALPAIRYLIVSDPRPEHLKGYDAARVTRVQADCFAQTYAEARELAELLIVKMTAPAAVAGVKFGHSKATGPRDLGEDTPTGFIHRASIDLLVEHGLA